MKKYGLLVGLTALGLIATATAEDYYKWTDEKGRVHYSSSPPPETARKPQKVDPNDPSGTTDLPTSTPASTPAVSPTPAATVAPATTEIPNALYILDGSGSMWGPLEGKPKIDTAKAVMADQINKLPPNVRTGLMVYGTNRKDDCNDITLLAPLGSNHVGLVLAVNSINPKGMTPLTEAIRLAAAQLKQVEGSASIVVVSDGKETCQGDPCVAAREAAQAGVNLRIHVVGFDVTPDETQQLTCIAKEGKGKYFAAANAEQLTAALTEVRKEVVAPPPPPPPVQVAQTPPPVPTPPPTPPMEQGSGKYYPDGHRGSVFFPLGDISFADEIVSYNKGTPHAKPEDSDPSEALGIPNYDKAKDKRYVVLGCRGVLTLRFVDNVLVDTDGPDLYVFEIGPDIEPTKLSISKDGIKWVDVGKIEGSTAAVDISSVARPEETFSYVRLEDLGVACGSEWPGADIDAVGAIGAGIRITLNESPVEVLFEDHFDRNELGEMWEVVNPDPNRLTLLDGKLLIVETKDDKNILRTQQVFSGNFVATVKVDTRVTSWNNVSLSYIIDRDNYLRVSLGQYCHPNQFTKVISGSANTLEWHAHKACGTKPETWYLQLERSGIKYTGRISADGTNWTDIGTHTVLQKEGRLGLSASSGGGEENTAEFDDFVVRGTK